jgi:hypothetical protein
MNRYATAAIQLRGIHELLTKMLDQMKAAAHKDMNRVAPGIWIHKDYRDLSDCLNNLPIP